jgi:hypothetical protein
MLNYWLNKINAWSLKAGRLIYANYDMVIGIVVALILLSDWRWPARYLVPLVISHAAIIFSWVYIVRFKGGRRSLLGLVDTLRNLNDILIEENRKFAEQGAKYEKLMRDGAEALSAAQEHHKDLHDQLSQIANDNTALVADNDRLRDENEGLRNQLTDLRDYVAGLD